MSIRAQKRRERYATDPEYRELIKEQFRNRYNTNPRYKQLRKIRYLNQRSDPEKAAEAVERIRRLRSDPDYRDSSNQRRRERYAADLAYRERAVQRNRRRRELMGGSKPYRYWRYLWLLQGGICLWCGKNIPVCKFQKTDPACPVVDHRTPIVAGGSSDLINLQCLHNGCNSTKGSKPMSEAQFGISEDGSYAVDIHDVLPFLTNEVEALRTVLHVAAELDLYEIAPIAARFAIQTEDPQIIQAAAVVCGHPSVGHKSRQVLTNHFLDNPLIERVDVAYQTFKEREQSSGWQQYQSTDGWQPTTVIDCAIPLGAGTKIAARLAASALCVRRGPMKATKVATLPNGATCSLLVANSRNDKNVLSVFYRRDYPTAAPADDVDSGIHGLVQDLQDVFPNKNIELTIR